MITVTDSFVAMAFAGFASFLVIAWLVRELYRSFWRK